MDEYQKIGLPLQSAPPCTPCTGSRRIVSMDLLSRVRRLPPGLQPPTRALPGTTAPVGAGSTARTLEGDMLAVFGDCPVCGRRQVIAASAGMGQVCDPRLCRHCCREHPGGGAFVALELPDGTSTACRPEDLHEPLGQWLARWSERRDVACRGGGARQV